MVCYFDIWVVLDNLLTSMRYKSVTLWTVLQVINKNTVWRFNKFYSEILIEQLFLDKTLTKVVVFPIHLKTRSLAERPFTKVICKLLYNTLSNILNIRTLSTVFYIQIFLFLHYLSFRYILFATVHHPLSNLNSMWININQESLRGFKIKKINNAFTYHCQF